jgi:hypothetical protein
LFVALLSVVDNEQGEILPRFLQSKWSWLKVERPMNVPLPSLSTTNSAIVVSVHHVHWILSLVARIFLLFLLDSLLSWELTQPFFFTVFFTSVCHGSRGSVARSPSSLDFGNEWMGLDTHVWTKREWTVLSRQWCL